MSRPAVWLGLPAPFPTNRITTCAICGGKPSNYGQFRSPEGMISVAVDSDLCLDCAILLWRAMKEQHADFRGLAFDLLRRYSFTRTALRNFDTKGVSSA